MKPVVECVPNFSEGRDRSVIDAIAAAVSATPGVRLLNVDPDADYNRTVVTFAGEPDAVVEAALAAAAVAAERIDMRTHHGEHPRLGALDVCPFVPVSGVTMQDCVELSRRFGSRLWKECGIPVYLYAEAAACPERKRLPDIRSGEYEGLAAKLANPAWAPDFGDATFNARSGATVAGARFFLVAYNINVASTDLSIADDAAKLLRESGFIKKNAAGDKVLDERGAPVRVPGMLRCVQAMGVELPSHGVTQISANILNYRVTPIHVLFEQAGRLVAERGASLRGSELIGLVPLEALTDCGRHALSLKGIASADEENMVAAAIDYLGLSTLAPFEPAKRVIEYLLRG